MTISISHLRKEYNGQTVLTDVNAEIQKGEIVSIIGPSGTGKSTFLRCLNLLEQPDGGEIRIDGVNILAPGTDIKKTRKKLGMVFQSFNLFSHLTVIENIMIGPIKLLGLDRQTAYDRGMTLLDQVGLSAKPYAWPDELSGGQKQRVAIARALAMEPEIILFDEPTSALDPTMVSEVLGVIRRLAETGMTMLIVTHEMRFAQDISSRVFYMDEGIIYEEGPPTQIFENPRRPKTASFIQQIRSLTYEINHFKFDLYELNAQIETFCHKYFLNPQIERDIQLLTEEILMNRILLDKTKEPNLTLSVNYSEKTNDIILSIINRIQPIDVFSPREDNDFSLMLINRLSSNRISSEENNVQTIQLTLRKK